MIPEGLTGIRIRVCSICTSITAFSVGGIICNCRLPNLYILLFKSVSMMKTGTLSRKVLPIDRSDSNMVHEAWILSSLLSSNFSS